MDLSKLAVSETATMDVRHPQTEDVIDGMSITFYGPTSPVVKKLQMAKQQSALNRLAKGKKALDLDAEKLTEESLIDQFKRAVSWEGFELDGEELDLTEDNWKLVMADFPWLAAQVSMFLGDDGNFLR